MSVTDAPPSPLRSREDLELIERQMVDGRLLARAYTREHGQDPAISGWTWPARPS